MVTGELDEHVVKDRDRHIKEQIWVVKRKMFLDQTEQAKENEK
jgi:glucan phosphorylase